jgi:hypothetical protein
MIDSATPSQRCVKIRSFLRTAAGRITTREV